MLLDKAAMDLVEGIGGRRHRMANSDDDGPHYGLLVSG
jgi:hypothetical protein